MTAASRAGAIHLRPSRETPRDLETIAHEPTHAAGEPHAGPLEGMAAHPGERARPLGGAVGMVVRIAGAAAGSSRAAVMLRATAAGRGALGREAPAKVGAQTGPVSTPPGVERIARHVAATPRPVRRAVERAPRSWSDDPGSDRPVSTRTPPFAGLGRVAAAVAPAVEEPRFADLPASPVSSLRVAGPAAATPQAAAGVLDDLPPFDTARKSADAITRSATSTFGGAESRGTETVRDVADAAETTGSRLLGATGGGIADSGTQLTHLLEALEERVVAELERRGGRYAGAF